MFEAGDAYFHCLEPKKDSQKDMESSENGLERIAGVIYPIVKTQ
jgi:hypothetical protein